VRRRTIIPTRNVVLTDHHQNTIDRLVSSGQYQNASEVLREGLRLVEAREARESAKLLALQEAARLGFADLEQGRYSDIQENELETFIAELGQIAKAKVTTGGA